MWNLPESTVNVLLSGLLGMMGGLLSVPVNAFILWKLKRKELHQQHKLDILAKERELLLQHRLEMKRIERDKTEVSSLQREMEQLKTVVQRLEQVVTHE